MTRFILAAIWLVWLTGCASVLAPNVNTEADALRGGAYKLDPLHAALLIKMEHLGLSTYVGRFNSFEATLDFDEAAPEKARLEAVIEIASLDVNNPSFAETLTGSGWLDAGTYPQARFVSREVRITGQSTGEAIGDLTIKGVTQPATLNIVFNGGARNALTTRYTIGFSGTMTVDRMDFGVDRAAGFVGDDVQVEFYGEFQRQ